MVMDYQQVHHVARMLAETEVGINKGQREASASQWRRQQHEVLTEEEEREKWGCVLSQQLLFDRRCRLGQLELVEDMLQLQAEDVHVNVPGPERGMTPLMCAVVGNHLEVVRVLLEHGADPHSRDNNEDGLTALDYARLYCQEDIDYEEMVGLLFDAGGYHELPPLRSPPPRGLPRPQ
uniref:Uncharacterized protein n=1 Tax=Noctiluca scintillans TaxID=2966 RepID=A0A7S1ALF4_NOCSC|mmetsp:Transcript_51231/g.136757  ORF Transcript_51231/g.136757 Transcript_51231/m.136757 type:complete len:178 (+) Transcript_51231:43-576(+)